jgi:hypothetical protein
MSEGKALRMGKVERWGERSGEKQRRELHYQTAAGKPLLGWRVTMQPKKKRMK